MDNDIPRKENDAAENSNAVMRKRFLSSLYIFLNHRVDLSIYDISKKKGVQMLAIDPKLEGVIVQDFETPLGIHSCVELRGSDLIAIERSVQIDVEPVVQKSETKPTQD